jgi:hypothetical protein
MGFTSLEANAQFLEEGGPTVDATLARAVRNAGGQGKEEGGGGGAPASKSLRRERQKANARARATLVVL